MPDQFKAGDRVLVGHTLGSGTVIRETEDGVLVRLDGGTVIEWQKSDTQLIGASATGPASVSEEMDAASDVGLPDEHDLLDPEFAAASARHAEGSGRGAGPSVGSRSGRCI